MMIIAIFISLGVLLCTFLWGFYSYAFSEGKAKKRIEQESRNIEKIKNEITKAVTASQNQKNTGK